MFGHLDDPVGVNPGHRELAAVLLRARARRVRHRLVAGAAALVVAAVVVGVVATQPSPVAVPSVETGFQFNALKGPLAVGTPVPTTALVNVTFASAQQGFALAAHRGQAVLAVTTDGGDTWRVQNSQLPPGYGQEAGYPGQFEFIGADGYLWGGAAEGNSVPLWVTDDGGVTWRQAPIGSVVYDVSAIGPDVWALTGSCDVNGAPPGSCALSLEVSLDGGATWVTTGPSGFADVMDAPPPAQRVELARITVTRSYVLTVSDPASPGAIGLDFTEDGGQSWQSRTVPCTGAFGLGAQIAASGTDDLWLLCGSQASAGSQSKELFRSHDGGATWSLAASATGLGTPPPPAGQSNTLPLSGYIAPYSIGHKNLAVASATVAWLYPFRSDMVRTTDGGATWTTVPGLNIAGFGSGGPGNVTFISLTEGWICEYGVGLWRTSDGVHWVPLGV
jgi:photosystem II stability/assembly factor-like uncharacterized protein